MGFKTSTVTERTGLFCQPRWRLPLWATCSSFYQVLAESDQLRKEADDLGPRAELDHWKKRMSRFNYLLEQLKSPDVKAVLGVLLMAKSKLIKVSGQDSTEPSFSLSPISGSVILDMITGLFLYFRRGGSWMPGSLTQPTRPKTMSSTSTVWRSSVIHSTTVTL